MSFIRLKTVSGKDYAYLVENTWTTKGPRQGVQSYLGRYIELPAADVPGTTAVDIAKIIADELQARGFSEKLLFDKIKVHLGTCTVRLGKKKAVLGLNGGFLCDYTLRKLIRFQPIEETTPGYGLARAFSDAGIRVSREQFVQLYKKVYKKQQINQ